MKALSHLTAAYPRATYTILDDGTVHTSLPQSAVARALRSHYDNVTQDGSTLRLSKSCEDTDKKVKAEDDEEDMEDVVEIEQDGSTSRLRLVTAGDTDQEVLDFYKLYSSISRKLKTLKKMKPEQKKKQLETLAKILPGLAYLDNML